MWITAIPASARFMWMLTPTAITGHGLRAGGLADTTIIQLHGMAARTATPITPAATRIHGLRVCGIITIMEARMGATATAAE